MEKQTLKLFCDKCDSEIVGKVYKYILPMWKEIEETDSYDGRVSVSHILTDEQVDLCEECRCKIALR